MKKKFNQIEYMNEYNQKHYKKKSLMIPIDIAKHFESKVKSEGKTVNGIVNEWIKDYMQGGK